MTNSLRIFEGSCHCGAIAFRFQASQAPELWPVRACQCSFCRRHGARTTSDPAGRTSFLVRDGPALLRYRFGSRTADFLVCRTCGVYLAAVLASPRGRFATLNVNTLTPVIEFGNITPMTRDGESAEERRRRRELHWTPVIEAA